MRFAATWENARLRAIRDLTADIREFEIVPDDGGKPFTPGAHLDIEVAVAGEPETRSYSLVGESGGDAYRIAVKRRTDSRGGSAYLWSLAPGARLRITAPKSAFEVELGRSDYLLVAGGIGITPLLGMASLLRRKGLPVRLAYAGQTEAGLAFCDPLREMLGENLDLFLSERGKRIDFSALFASLGPDAVCALCGPMPMLEDARRA
jgi:dimethylamine monooxygenase subunit B